MGLGVVERMKGNYTKAKDFYEQAIKINRNNPDVYSSLLMLEIKEGNYNEAVKLGEKARTLNFINMRPGILGNLVVAYHLNNQIEERDKLLLEGRSCDLSPILKR